MAFKETMIESAVRQSLAEDIGDGDITAALIPQDKISKATIITRENVVICGIPWVDEVYRQIDSDVKINWQVKEGQSVHADTLLATLVGKSRSLLTGERTALNWLQTLSGTATLVSHYVEKLAGTKTKLLDTRKTIPGLRYAQKYAVRCGGGVNHRQGLYDAFLIKENHIASAGSIAAAVKAAQAQHSNKLIEVEVENLSQLQEALSVGVTRVLLDNFSRELIREAVQLNQGRALLEVSGNVTLESVREVAETGVDFISVGSLTKHLMAIDLSMRVQ